MGWQDTVREIGESSAAVPQVHPEDVPDLELYMDQLITFLDRQLGELKREKNQPFVTNTMVNNYAKARLIPPAEHKRYRRRHVLGLSFVGQLKRVLSMQDISKLVRAGQQSFEDGLYATFLSAQSKAFADAPKLLEEAAAHCKTANQSDSVALAAVAAELAAQAQCRILLAERLLDAMEEPPLDEVRKKGKA